MNIEMSRLVAGTVPVGGRRRQAAVFHAIARWLPRYFAEAARAWALAAGVPPEMYE